MQRVVALSLALLLCLSVVAQADPVITLGTYNFNTNTSVGAIQIFGSNNTASGPNNGSFGFNLNVQIFAANGITPATGGPVFVLGTPGQGVGSNTGYVGPASGLNTGGDLLGVGTIANPNTMWNVAGHSVPADGGNSVAQNLSMNVTVPFTTLSNTPNGSLLATLYISTNGVAGNTNWSLNIGGGLVILNTDDDPPSIVRVNGNPGHALPDSGETNFADASAYNTFLTDGVIHINAVPEPSSIILGLLAAAGLAVVIRRKRSA